MVGVRSGQFTPQGGNEANASEHGANDDDVRATPVFLPPIIEDDLENANRDDKGDRDLCHRRCRAIGFRSARLGKFAAFSNPGSSPCSSRRGCLVEVGSVLRLVLEDVLLEAQAVIDQRRFLFGFRHPVATIVLIPPLRYFFQPKVVFEHETNFVR